MKQAVNMKFVIENISKSSERLGHLIQADTGKQFKTPLLLQATKSGSIPYLSREVFDYVSNDVPMLQLCLCSIDHMAESMAYFKAGGFNAYVGFKESPSMLMIRDACEHMPSGFNDRDVVPLFTRRGKEPLSAERYMQLVEAFAPDIYQGLSDADANLTSAKKRVQKSVDRTEQFMDYCYETHKGSKKLQKSAIFAPIVGGYNTYARSQSIKHAKDKGDGITAGYLLEGFHNYGLTASEVQSKHLLPIVEHCQKQLTPDKPKMMPGAYTPLVILELIGMGIDMFDTSYAYCAAHNYKALLFSFDLEKKQQAHESIFLDLTDECFKEDFTPLLKDCACLSCQKHTRGYIHHLYKTKEILGPILLMIHNLHHYMQFFEAIRACICNDTLSALIELIKFQGAEQEQDYAIKANTKVISKAGMGKAFNLPKTKAVVSES